MISCGRMLYAGVLTMLSPVVFAGSISIAVASNFSAPIHEIKTVFEQRTGHSVSVSIGSTGKLATQIQHGAPFQVFLSADQKTPELLVTQKLALPETMFTYATGRLVLWSYLSNPLTVQQQLLQQQFKKISLSQPETTPYGRASLQALTALKLMPQIQPKIVYGDSVMQAYQFTKTGNVDLGFVSYSEVFLNGKLTAGRAWVVPQTLYTPLKQNAILLKKAENAPVAKLFLNFLKSESATTIIRRYGYTL